MATKQNLSPPSGNDRLYRLVSVKLANAEPPIYPNGDDVAVIELFTPSVAPLYPQAILAAAVSAIAQANPPLAPAGRNSGLSAIAEAIAPLRNGQASEADAKAIVDHLVRQGTVAVTNVNVARPGRGSYTRKGLAVIGASAVQSSPISHQPPKPTTAAPQ